MTPSHVTFLNPVGGLGGAEQSLLRILRVLRRFSPDTHCHLLAGSEGPMLPIARELGVSVDVFPLADTVRKLGDAGLRGHGKVNAMLRLLTQSPAAALATTTTVRWLRRWFAEHPTDLIHSNGLKTHILSAFSRPSGTPLIWHIRDFPGDRPLMRRALRRLGPRATMAIANSKAVAEDARRVFRTLPVATLYNTVDTDQFSPSSRDGSQLDVLASLPVAGPETVRIGLVATYANWKGHDVLLKAAAHLPGNVRVYLVGEPIYATPGSQFSKVQLEDLSTTLGIRDRVGFIPFQRNPADIYRMLDVVVHASTRPEPFGLTIAEAMSCGRAVIVSAAGGAAELFTEGVDALGHPPGNVEALASALKRLIEDPELRQRLGGEARRTAVERYSAEPFARELLKIYSECIAR